MTTSPPAPQMARLIGLDGTQHANQDNDDLSVGDHNDDRLMSDFIRNYPKVMSCYQAMTQAVHSICEEGLKNMEHGSSAPRGIRCEFYTRPTESSNGPFYSAKMPDSMKRTLVRRRANRERAFESEDDIFQSMYDLSAITIALYYPNDLDQVRNFIGERFELVATGQWPDFRNVNPQIGKVPYPQLGMERQFQGYVGSHFIVKLKGEDLTTGGNGNLEGCLAEIQVKSLIMWAWQKVHHELIYKPGTEIQTDQDDERLLDLSNGVIMAGEIALKQIQININKRRQEPQREFKNAYAMLDYISTKWINNDSKPEWLEKYHLAWSYRDILFTSLREFKYNTPNRLDKLIEACEELPLDDADGESEHDLLARILYKLAQSREVLEKVGEIVPNSDMTRNSYSNRLKRLRYRLWLVCRAIQWLYSSYVPQSRRELVMSKVEYRVRSRPELSDIICLLHPRKPPRELLQRNNTAVFDEVERFCDEILNTSMYFHFNLAVALAQLTWYITPGKRVRGFVRKKSSLQSLVHYIYHDAFSIEPATIFHMWPQPRNETNSDVDWIASCPLQLKQLACDSTGLRVAPTSRIAKFGFGSDQEKPLSNNPSANSYFSERTAKALRLPQSKELISILTVPPGLGTSKEKFGSVQGVNFIPWIEVGLMDAMVVPYIYTMKGSQEPEDQWAIAGSQSDKGDWVSNCAFAGFDNLKAYLDSSDS